MGGESAGDKPVSGKEIKGEPTGDENLSRRKAFPKEAILNAPSASVETRAKTLIDDEQMKSTFAGRFLIEFNGARELFHTNPRLFVVFIIIVLGIFAHWSYQELFGIPRLNATIDSQKQTIQSLQTELEPFKTVALERYGGDNNQAIARLADDIQKFESKLRMSEGKIRSLDAAITIDFSAKWKGGKVPNTDEWISLGGSRVMSMDFLLDDATSAPTEFHHDEDLNIAPLEGQRFRLTYRATAAPGSQVFGILPKQIRNVKDFSFDAFGFSQEFIDGTEAVIYNVRIDFFVNGKISFSATNPVTHNVAIPVENPTFYRMSKILPVVLSESEGSMNDATGSDITLKR
jgi:hypothetical protein